MVNLTDDSNFSSLRLEFKSKNGEMIKTDKVQEEDQNWAMNDQNQEEDLAPVDDDEGSYQDEEDFVKNENMENEQNYEEEGFEEEPVETTEAVKSTTYAFKFAAK